MADRTERGHEEPGSGSARRGEQAARAGRRSRSAPSSRVVGCAADRAWASTMTDTSWRPERSRRPRSIVRQSSGPGRASISSLRPKATPQAIAWSGVVTHGSASGRDDVGHRLGLSQSHGFMRPLDRPPASRHEHRSLAGAGRHEAGHRTASRCRPRPDRRRRAKRPLASTNSQMKPATIAAAISSPPISSHLRTTSLGFAVSQPRLTAAVLEPALEAVEVAERRYSVLSRHVRRRASRSSWRCRRCSAASGLGSLAVAPTQVT